MIPMSTMAVRKSSDSERGEDATTGALFGWGLSEWMNFGSEDAVEMSSESAGISSEENVGSWT